MRQIPGNRIICLIIFVLVIVILIAIFSGIVSQSMSFGVNSSNTRGMALQGQNFPIVLGNASVKVPDRCDLINTSEWGEVPSDMVVVVLKEGKTREDADRVARTLNATVVGYYDYINLYQVEFHTVCAAHNETDLRNQIALAKLQKEVDFAYPNSLPILEHGYSETEMTAITNPVYTEWERDNGYEMIGADEAWDIIRGSGVQLSPVHVAIVDDGIYTGYLQFGKGVTLDTSISGSTLKAPLKGWEKVGSHGTGIANIIGAHTGWEGITGIASESLRENLTMTPINIRVPPYGNSFESMATGQDGEPVLVLDAKTYSVGNIVAIKDAIEHGATIISISWGNSEASPDDAATYRKFFEKINREYPYILFVCSAGNDNRALDGSKRYPSGLSLPNMVTVGNVRNDGSNRARSSMSSSNYEVTLAAPGQQAVYGVDLSGNVTHANGGSSMAAPHVSATAALLRGLNPNLSAGEIKEILVRSGRTEIQVGNKTVQAPSELGGRYLATDLAVLEVINSLRSKQGLSQISYADADNSTDIFLTLKPDPENSENSLVSAFVPAGFSTATNLRFTLESGGITTDTKEIYLAELPAEADWSVNVPVGIPSRIKVTRTDSNSVVYLDVENT